MSKGRYDDAGILEGRYYATADSPSLSRHPLGLGLGSALDGVRTTEHVVCAGERIDQLAARYYNDDSLWWVIALANGIKYPFTSGGFVPGRVLQVPVDPKDVFDRVFRRS